MSYTGTGFQAGDPLFVLIDGAGDCTNPTAGTKVFSTSSYAEPLAPDASPLPDAVTPGAYQLRACNHRPGESPSNCAQVPFSVVAIPSPTPASTASTARTQ